MNQFHFKLFIHWRCNFFVLSLAIKYPSSINTKPKSQNVVVVKEDSSSTKLEEVSVSKDTYDSESS